MRYLDATAEIDGFAKNIQPITTEVDAWVWMSYDQLNVQLLCEIEQKFERIGLILIESELKGRSRPYHKQKLALLLSNLRHFALEAQSNGYPIRYVATRSSYSDAIVWLSEHIGPLHCIEHAEYSTRREIEPLIDQGILTEHSHLGWLTPRHWFTQVVGNTPPFRMEKFYRTVRNEMGWLMENGKPLGGKYSFDEANRKPWRGEPVTPRPHKYSVDQIDVEVSLLIERIFSDHPGHVDFTILPTSDKDIQQAIAFARECLVHFGTYEDAMSIESRGLFHTRLASLLNLHRIMPMEAVELALESTSEINNVEGFLRQLIWREYVHHIHAVTDGFRTLDVSRSPSRRDANWFSEAPLDIEQHPNHLKQIFPLPRAYWGTKSGLTCLDISVTSVMEEGWTHHIPRLMVLSNIAHLLDVHPRELTDWFHVAFTDAYDWVVEPNVLGMGTFALGSAMMTKPYVAGSAYINRMSDYCKSCDFHPKTCPISRLYWAYLARHSSALSDSHRLSMAMRNVSKRSDEQRDLDHATFLMVQDALSNGRTLSPKDQINA